MAGRNGTKDPLNASCAKFMKETRLKLGIPQKDVAKALGISQVTYSDIERGNYKVTLTDFVRFSQRYIPEVIKEFPKELKNHRYIM